MVQSNSTSIFVRSQVPDFWNRDAPELVEFIKFYYEWMEQYENPVYVARKLSEYKDVDLIPDKFFKFMRNEFMKNIPVTMADDRLLLKNIVDFYRAKGTEKSYKMLFRILYGDETVSFYYPGKDILRASDGKWVIERSLKLNLKSGIEVEDLVSIRGGTSGATARRDKFLSYISNEVKINELYINNVFGTFVPGEVIIDEATDQEIGYVQANGVVTYAGKWEGTDGFLSADKYLQDNNFYQEYSYQIRSAQNLKSYEQVAYNLVHPSGTKLFGAVELTENLNFAQVLDLSVISTLGSDESPRITVNFQISIPANDSDITVDDIVYDIDSVGAGVHETLKFDTIAPLWDTQIFSSNLGDMLVVQMDIYRWMQSNISSYTFPDWTPLEIEDISNSDTVFIFAENVVNTTLLVLSTEYPYGAATGLTYKYYTIA